jgi:hypothetical protein
MGVDKLLFENAAALARVLDTIDKKALIEKVLAAVDPAAEPVFDPSVPSEGGDPAAVGTPLQEKHDKSRISVAEFTAGSHPCHLSGDESDDEYDDEEVMQVDPAEELCGHLEHALFDSRCARRVAELYEWFGQLEKARNWWYFAAAKGDKDAQLYVKYQFGIEAETVRSDLDTVTARLIVATCLTMLADDKDSDTNTDAPDHRARASYSGGTLSRIAPLSPNFILVEGGSCSSSARTAATERADAVPTVDDLVAVICSPDLR